MTVRPPNLHKFGPVAAALLYCAVFHYAYATYINPVFEYAHFNYFRPSWLSALLAYAFAIAPLAAYRESAAPAAQGAVLVFCLCYVPSQLILLFGWERGAAELYAIQFALLVSMAILFWCSRRGFKPASAHQKIRRLSISLGVATWVTLAILVIVFRDHMRLVSFADVYDLRAETGAVETSAAIDYPLSWLSYCFLPFFIARGVLRRNVMDVGWALLGSALIYATTGSKASILMPLIVLGLHVVMGPGTRFLLRLLVALAASVLIVILIVPDEGALLWIKSIFLMRVLATGGWVISTYYEFFSTNGYTFYTHIGPVNALTGAYPYGELSLGQLIGLQYAGSIEANFNANFWASDGFAALGLAGVPVVTAALGWVFYGINRLSRGYPPRFVALWLAGFWLALLNVPLTTALLSGGGALTLIFLAAARRGRATPLRSSFSLAPTAH